MIPLWVQRMPAIWIATVQGLDPRMPTGATVLSLVQAHAGLMLMVLVPPLP